MTSDTRAIVDHEVLEQDLHVTLEDGAQYVARGFVGPVSATDAWDDIAGHTFGAACQEYEFESLTD